VTAVEFPGDHFLLVVQPFESLLFLQVPAAGAPIGHFNPDDGKKKLAEMVYLVWRQFEWKQWGEHLLQDSGKALPGSIPADV
jgi:hypothetical protein